MKTKKAAVAEQAKPTAKESEAREPVEAVAAPQPHEAADTKVSAASDVTRKSIAFYEDSAGNIDIDRLQDRSKKQLAKLLRDPKLAQKLGVAPIPGAEVKKAEPITLEMVVGLYGVIGNVDSLIAARAFKIPRDIANTAFTFTEKQKEQIAPLTRNILNKRFGNFLQKYLAGFEEEALLASILAGTLAAQYKIARRMQMESEGTKAPRPLQAREAVAVQRTGATNGSAPAPAAEIDTLLDIQIPDDPSERFQ